MKKKSKITLILFSFLTALTFVIGGIFSPIGLKASANTTILNTSTPRYFTYASYGSVINSYEGNNIWTDGSNVYYSTSYVFQDYAPRFTNQGLTFSGAPSSFVADNIWTDGSNIFYSAGSTHKKVISNGYSVSFANYTFSESNELSSFNGSQVWTDGSSIYFISASNGGQYRFYSTSNAWVNIDSYSSLRITFNGIYSNLVSVNGLAVFNFNNNTVYFNNNTVYILDGTDFITLSSFYRDPNLCWTDGLNLYYSNGSTQEVFNIIDGSWTSFDWTFGYSKAVSLPFTGDDVFIFNDVIYSSYHNGNHFNLISSYNLFYQKSYNLGKEAGYSDGYTAGYNAGLNEGSTSDSYNSGYNAGYTAGISTNSGYSAGYDSGYNLGYNTGYGEGQQVGYTAGSDAGYNTGYNEGYDDGLEDSGEYSFLSLISATIDAPIRAFTGLFNFEIFDVNIKNLLLALFTASVIIVIVKLCLGGK